MNKTLSAFALLTALVIPLLFVTFGGESDRTQSASHATSSAADPPWTLRSIAELFSSVTVEDVSCLVDVLSLIFNVLIHITWWVLIISVTRMDDG